MRKRPSLVRRETHDLLNFYECAATATTITSNALNLNTVPQPVVTGDRRRNENVVAVR